VHEEEVLRESAHVVHEEEVLRESAHVVHARGGVGANDHVDDLPMRCSLYVQSDQSFTFVSKAPRTSFYIKAAACVEKGANKPGSEIVGAVHVKQIYEIAKIRQLDDAYMKEMPLESICKSIAAQCRGTV
jgi:ribosomal protein L11